MSKLSFRNILFSLFGVFMVVVYLGMAWLFAVNFFDWDVTPAWTAARLAMAVLLGLYGMYRGYRLVAPSNEQDDDDDDSDEPRYGNYADQPSNTDAQ